MVLASLVAATPLHAAGPVDEDILKRLEALERRNDELERRNRDLASEVAVLRTSQGEEWLTEERAAQIRQIVEDVLVDAGSRASLRQDGMTAGWNDGFFMASPDGRFKLQVGGLLQTRFVWSNIRTGQTDPTVQDRKQDRYAFDLPNTQLWFRGHVFGPSVQYMVKARFTNNTAIFLGEQGPVPLGDGSGTLQLMDAWIRFQLTDNWSVRAGQYRSPYSREFLIPEQYQLAVNRSIVDFHMGLGYTQGVELQFISDDIRWLLSLDDGGNDNLSGPALSTVDGNPANSPWFRQDSDISVTTRLEWKPFGAWQDFASFTSPMGQAQGWLLGAAFHYQQSQLPILNSPVINNLGGYNEWYAWTVDSQYNFGGASLFGSFYYNYLESPAAYLRTGFNPPQPVNLGFINIWGLVLQGAIYIAPKWELFARYELSNWRATNQNSLPLAFRSPSMLNVATVGVNWYINGQDVKLTTDIGYSFTATEPQTSDLQAGWRTASSDQFVFRTRLQLMF
ncbi:MAG: hypothetical protein KF724_12595 [Phycisphaeraceae bacterium]|nr:hypothetical protein [Phycisphaeraceae bacterium]